MFYFRLLRAYSERAKEHNEQLLTKLFYAGGRCFGASGEMASERAPPAGSSDAPTPPAPAPTPVFDVASVAVSVFFVFIVFGKKKKGGR